MGLLWAARRGRYLSNWTGFLFQLDGLSAEYLTLPFWADETVITGRKTLRYAKSSFREGPIVQCALPAP